MCIATGYTPIAFSAQRLTAGLNGMQQQHKLVGRNQAELSACSEFRCPVFQATLFRSRSLMASASWPHGRQAKQTISYKLGPCSALSVQA
jgi:hypothetical protein